VERIVASRFAQHAEDNHLFSTRQSPYRRGHSTETAMLCVYNIWYELSTASLSPFVLLDLSSTFNTVDHFTLLTVSQLLQWLAAAVHAEASRMIYSVLPRDMHAATMMSPEIALWRVCGLPGPDIEDHPSVESHSDLSETSKLPPCCPVILEHCSRAASPAVFKGASLTWSRPPVLAYSRARPCCSYQGHLVEVTGWSAE